MHVFQNGHPFNILFSTTCGMLKKKSEARGPFWGIWEAGIGPGAHLRIRGAHFGRCFLCLWRVSWSVKCVLNDVFLRCVLERHDVSQDHGGRASVVAIFWSPVPATAIFSMAYSSCAERTVLVVLLVNT